jgi:5'-3' exonuclease
MYYKNSYYKGGKDIDVFKDICNNIDKILRVVTPRKTLVLCVDGPAPLSKQNQQRQRRFMSTVDNGNNRFDSNCITPGTLFMHNLSKYIDWYIRKKISENNKNSPWYYIDVIFSNEKVPGEGEHKLLNFIRNSNKDDSFIIYGPDSDLIMLGLGTHIKKFYIIRDDIYNIYEYNIINIGNVYKEITELLRWNDSEVYYKSERAIDDFIFICFILGNDFLPNIPGIDIKQGGLEFALNIYKDVAKDFGHLTKKTKDIMIFKKENLIEFLGRIGDSEKEIFQNKLKYREKYIKDEIYDECIDEKNIFHIKKYRKLYYENNFAYPDKEKICNEYLKGMLWVLNYYNIGVPDWNWNYQYKYAPFSYNITRYIWNFEFPTFEKNEPIKPFNQLMAVIPPQSSNLLPRPLSEILNSEQFKTTCPLKFNIDYNGKQQKWEGIPVIPFADYKEISSCINENINNIDNIDNERNIIGKTIKYLYCEESIFLLLSYGDFECFVKTLEIDI